ncbi:MAG: biosynthetic peptidoglycan transglycosylase [Bacillota bacterium]|nr:biosynthetic peptidoglycan transglycosylase [Bacillota bacterium]
MKVKNILLLVLIIALLLIPIKIVPIVIDGHTMYTSAIEENSIEEKVDQVRSTGMFVKVDEISDVFLEMLIQSEDQRFYEHNGFDLKSTGRALLKNIQTGAKVEGGSSITQQLAKNLYFTFDKIYERKVAELFVALQLEKLYEKDEILELYLNVAYFGNGQYGIEAASRYYYGVGAFELNQEQSQELVKTLKSPSLFNPNAIKEFFHAKVSDLSLSGSNLFLCEYSEN